MQKPDLIEFRAGAKAKAQEVNQNFEELSDYVFGSNNETKSYVDSQYANFSLDIREQIKTLTQQVNNLSEQLDDAKQALNNIGYDWANMEDRNLGAEYTADTNGFVVFTSGANGGYAMSSVAYVNRSTIASSYSNQSVDTHNFFFPVSKNDTYKIDSNSGKNIYLFVPFKNIVLDEGGA